MLRALPRSCWRPVVNSLMAMVPLPSKSKSSKTFLSPQAMTSIPRFSRSFCMRMCCSRSWNSGHVSSPEPSWSASSKNLLASVTKRLRRCSSWMSMFSSSCAVIVVASSTKIPVMMFRTQKTAKAMYKTKRQPSQGENSRSGLQASPQFTPPEMLMKSVKVAFGSEPYFDTKILKRGSSLPFSSWPRLLSSSATNCIKQTAKM
mmetsp:Transcript_24477/g.76131  ORF Transcript_24477/g.76131 Transcript_24477/m.76131 type:complete len:203 (-) Transcript_24477:840-1448(-)